MIRERIAALIGIPVDNPRGRIPAGPVACSELRAHRSATEASAHLPGTPTGHHHRADGAATPDGESGVAALLTNHDAIRDGLQDLRAKLMALIDNAHEGLDVLDELDPTPAGLAAAAEVTDLGSRRAR